MRIRTKILSTLLGMTLLVALVGALAVNRQRVAALVGATTEAQDVARLVSFLLLSDTNKYSASSIQEIVVKLHQKQGRDVVLMDSNQLILADAVPSEIGKMFTNDPGDEAGATIKDRQVRTFLEVSQDYPAGIKQIVVPVESESGQVMGAVVLEYTPLYNELMRLAGNTIRQVVLAGFGSVVIALLIAFYMGRSIGGPLQQLTDVATGFAAGRTDLPMPPPRKDEIGQLATAFHHMVQKRRQVEAELRRLRDELEVRVVERTAELEEAHKRLVEASRQAGMAEIATNVLHNVGNVLNSVNISAELIVATMKKSRASSFARVVVLLEEHAHDLGEFITNDSKGKQLPAYLARLSEHLLADQVAVVSELDSLQRNVGHIKEIVARQQNYATFGGVKEMVNVTNLVEDSLRMNEGALSRLGVTVIREFEPVRPMNVEKHKILQILVNLVRNAKQACRESDRADKRLTVRVANSDGQVKLSVMDNGIGINPENLARIFSHGFTTRKDGHGFGLHSGALAANEMGGSLIVQSEGAGQGATFTLELPTEPEPGSTAEVTMDSQLRP